MVTTRSIARRAPYEAVLLDADLQWTIMTSSVMTARSVLNFLVALRTREPLRDTQLHELGVMHFATPLESQFELGLAVNHRHESLLTDIVAEIIGRGVQIIKSQKALARSHINFLLYHDMQMEAALLSSRVLFIEPAMKGLFGRNEAPSIRFYLNRYGRNMTLFFANVVSTIVAAGKERRDCFDTPSELSWADLLTAQPLRAHGHPKRLLCDVPDLLVATRHQLRQVLRLLDDKNYTGG